MPRGRAPTVCSGCRCSRTCAGDADQVQRPTPRENYGAAPAEPSSSTMIPDSRALRRPQHEGRRAFARLTDGVDRMVRSRPSCGSSPHPAAGRRFMATHERRHFEQARRVIQNPHSQKFLEHDGSDNPRGASGWPRAPRSHRPTMLGRRACHPAPLRPGNPSCFQGTGDESRASPSRGPATTAAYSDPVTARYRSWQRAAQARVIGLSAPAPAAPQLRHLKRRPCPRRWRRASRRRARPGPRSETTPRCERFP